MAFTIYLIFRVIAWIGSPWDKAKSTQAIKYVILGVNGLTMCAVFFLLDGFHAMYGQMTGLDMLLLLIDQFIAPIYFVFGFITWIGSRKDKTKSKRAKKDMILASVIMILYFVISFWLHSHHAYNTVYLH